MTDAGRASRIDLRTESGVREYLRDCGALLEGHFLLSSGLHSSGYVQCALALQHPREAGEVGAALAEKWSDVAIDTVVGPALGGLIIGHEVARALGVRSLFTERTADSKMALRRGFEIAPGSRILVVEDVVTTGGSSREVIEILESLGGRVVGVASIVNRSKPDEEPFGSLPFLSLITLDFLVWDPSTCELCRSGAPPAVKPGSRK